MRTCKDCGVEVKHSGGKGRWPERCPEHQYQRDLELHREAKRARRAAVEHNCLDCSTALTKISQKWPIRCPDCQTERVKARRVKSVRKAKCIDCGVEWDIYGAGLLPKRCAGHAKQANNKSILASIERRRAENPEEFRTKARIAEEAWRARNPDKVLNKNHFRRVATTGAEAEEILVEALIERDGVKCSLCPEEINFDLAWPDVMSRSIEHVIPVSKGGSHTYENVTLAHLGCNIRKSDRLLD